MTKNYRLNSPSASFGHFFPQTAPGAILVTTRDKRIGERLAVKGQNTTVPAMEMSEVRQLLNSYLPAALRASTNIIEQPVESLEY